MSFKYNIDIQKVENTQSHDQRLLRSLGRLKRDMWRLCGAA